MKRFFFGLCAALWLTTAQANVPCTLPFALQNNTIADATQVMANYNALVTCLTNAAAAGANSDITSLLGLTTPVPYTAGGSSTYIAGTSTGSANAQVVASPTPTGFSLTAGKTIVFIAGFTNTGAAQINVATQGLTNVFRMTPSGAQALTGGEIVAGNLTFATYDGTQFQLLSTHGQFGGFGPLTNLTSVGGTPDLGTIPSHNVNITGTTTITAFGSSASTTYPRYRVTFAGALTLTYNASSLILPGAASIVTAANDTMELLYLGTGNWQVTAYAKANGTAVVNPTPLCGAVGLKITNNAGTPNTNIDWSADQVVMINPTGNVPIYRAAVSGTINTTNANVINGIDTSRGASTWYNIYLMDNGSTTGAYASTTATGAFGTQPTGYVYWCRLGVMRTDGSTNFLRTLQLGSDTQYTVVGSTNTPNLPLIANGVAGTYTNVTPPTYVAASISTFAPPTATQMSIVAITNYNNGADSAVILAPNANYSGSATTNPPPFNRNVVSNAFADTVVPLVLESTNVYWVSTSAGGALLALGWKDKVNAH